MINTLLRVAVIVAVVAALMGFLALTYVYNSCSRVIDERLASGFIAGHEGLYAAPRILRPGQRFTPEQLTGDLRRAGYTESNHSFFDHGNAAVANIRGAGDAESNHSSFDHDRATIANTESADNTEWSAVASGQSRVWNGSYACEPGAIVVRRFRSGPESAPASIAAARISVGRDSRISAITAPDGQALPSFALDPERLNGERLKTNTRRGELTFSDIPRQIVSAIIAIEDRRFFSHHGVDTTAVMRAMWRWTTERESASGATEADSRLQGGSTITQQLVKNVFLSPERTLRRKLYEAVMAAILEHRLSKEEIFALYADEIYLGRRGGVGVAGVDEAARVFFGKDLRSLTLGEAATIAGMIQSPARYAPDRHPESAKARRNLVLAAMLREGSINEECAREAMNEEVVVAPEEIVGDATAPYFADYATRMVDATGDSRPGADEHGLRIMTTLDSDLQQLAENSLKVQLDRLCAKFHDGACPQAALVALDPHDGHILAMVGGRSYGESQLNRVTDARRQPGSVFKPFVYATALENGMSPLEHFLDAPQTFRYDARGIYKPGNFGEKYSMSEVTMRQGLAHSLNVVAVQVAMKTGLDQVADFAHALGLERPEPYPSLALGTGVATPLQIAAAYAAFANGGYSVDPVALVQVLNGSGYDLLAQQTAMRREVVRPATTSMLTDMLSEVIKEGTAHAISGEFRGQAIAGKTGTSRDGWFAGYTPSLVCVVWVGFDDNRQLGLTGAASAMPIWSEFMSKALEMRPELGGASFTHSEDTTTVEIDPATGGLASSLCARRERIVVARDLLDTIQPCIHEIADRRPSQGPVSSPEQVVAVAPAPVRPRASIMRVTGVEVLSNGRMRLANEMQF